jgi:hypothetical protein
MLLFSFWVHRMKCWKWLLIMPLFVNYDIKVFSVFFTWLVVILIMGCDFPLLYVFSNPWWTDCEFWLVDTEYFCVLINVFEFTTLLVPRIKLSHLEFMSCVEIFLVMKWTGLIIPHYDPSECCSQIPYTVKCSSLGGSGTTQVLDEPWTLLPSVIFMPLDPPLVLPSCICVTQLFANVWGQSSLHLWTSSPFSSFLQEFYPENSASWSPWVLVLSPQLKKLARLCLLNPLCPALRLFSQDKNPGPWKTCLVSHLSGLIFAIIAWCPIH